MREKEREREREREHIHQLPLRGIVNLLNMIMRRTIAIILAAAASIPGECKERDIVTVGNGYDQELSFVDEICSGFYHDGDGVCFRFSEGTRAGQLLEKTHHSWYSSQPAGSFEHTFSDGKGYRGDVLSGDNYIVTVIYRYHGHEGIMIPVCSYFDCELRWGHLEPRAICLCEPSTRNTWQKWKIWVEDKFGPGSVTPTTILVFVALLLVILLLVMYVVVQFVFLFYKAV
jgi:hypothetical protein